MAYSKTTWAANDVITAAKLNKMEQGIYDGQNGWEAGVTQLFSETVTTVDDGGYYGSFAYNQLIDSDVIEVTFNGVKYRCDRIVMNGWTYYGGITQQGSDFTVYPFVISSGNDSGTVYNDLETEAAGTYTVAVSAIAVTVSDNFASAVAKAVPAHDFEIIPGTTTWAEAYTAFSSKKNVYYFLGSNQKVNILHVGVGQGDVYRVAGVTVDSASLNLSPVNLQASSRDGVLS